MTEPAIRNISDTARWAAMYRAIETDRPDALFRDPFARKLAGERGQQIVELLRVRERFAWAWSMRTYLFDRFIREQIAEGADMVVNLAAGLDARPYRMELPATLQWIEVDLPELLAYKESIIRNEKPACRLERVALDLSNVAARRDLFARLAARAKKIVVITEGLLIYLSAEEVGALARDLAPFQQWVTDIVSPGLLRMLQKQLGDKLDAAQAPLKFAPPEGPPFFEKYGWRVLAVESTLKNAARVKRVGLFFRLIAKLPDSKGAQGNRPWSATCLLGH
ncbi:MAG TPA: SAM-dependent methyltransferase [Thermoanaerobaculia bacterium]|jgi:methyltransferase (TIGR00027 family)|nr:SAM-dependent methyltransferase [Thermoanaerobaculia bacterium]